MRAQPWARRNSSYGLMGFKRSGVSPLTHQVHPHRLPRTSSWIGLRLMVLRNPIQRYRNHVNQGSHMLRFRKKQSGKVSRTTNHGEDKVQSATVTVPVTTAVQAQPHPPDLLDLGEPVGDTSSYSSTVDPFKQLEGLLDLSQDFNATAAGTSNGPDLMSLYSDTDTNGNPNQNLNPVNGSVNPSKKPALLTKGPSLKDALDKDALVRQMGVNPTGQNPNLFSDLLG
ncbi:hypothetical protein HanRHA438_Chr03g0137551 [Helianthus annuus]|nr:hypothetical protein HanRHA438_Chr03g0137551 [Helianthus annuus]